MGDYSTPEGQPQIWPGYAWRKYKYVRHGRGPGRLSGCSKHSGRTTKVTISPLGSHGYEVLATSIFLPSAYEGWWPVLSLVSFSHSLCAATVLIIAEVASRCT